MKKEKTFIETSSKSVLDEKERRLLELSLGAEPKNEKERRLKKQIKEIEAKGGMVEIPHN